MNLASMLNSIKLLAIYSALGIQMYWPFGVCRLSASILQITCPLQERSHGN